MKPQPIESRASFQEIRYASCWEDAEVLCEALAPLAGARCLSIASAGDNSLSLLARGASVLAVDVSSAQLALVELKAAAFAELEHEELLSFLGARAPGRDAGRLHTYRLLRTRLGAPARGFWDTHPDEIEAGVVHGGKLERYFRLFRRLVLPLAHGEDRVRALLAPGRDAAGQAAFVAEHWDTWRWRLLGRLFFGRLAMGRLGRDPEFFRHVQGPVAAPILERAAPALACAQAGANPYLTYILTGGFGAALPDYLRPEHHGAIRESLPSLRLWQGPVEAALREASRGAFDALNLSDVPEYMDLQAYHALLAAVRHAGARGARLAYWNLLAPRRRPPAMSDWLEERREQGRALHARAGAFFYGAFVLEVAR